MIETAAFAVVALIGIRLARPRVRPLRDLTHVASSKPARRGAFDSLRMRLGGLWIRLRRRRHACCAPAAVADWCDEVARRVRAGASIRDALAATVPIDEATRDATDRLRQALAHGASSADAVSALPTGRGPHLVLARQVVAVATQLGGSPAAAIDRTAVVLRQRAADGAERLTHAAQARMSAHVLTVLPVAVLSILAVSDGDVRDVLASPTGAVLVSIGLGLNGIGWCWMRHLVRERR